MRASTVSLQLKIHIEISRGIPEFTSPLGNGGDIEPF